MRLCVAHNSKEKLPTYFYTVVVKNESLIGKYKGGLKAFFDKYAAFCNEHITYNCHMGSDLEDTINHLVRLQIYRHEKAVAH